MTLRARPAAGGALRAAAVLLLLLLQGAPPARAQNQPDFFGLGDLPGGAVDSLARAVSVDGLVVVGESESGSGTEAFRWTQAGGMVGLGTLSGGDFFSTANAVSANGSVVVGTASTGNGSAGFRWTTGGMVGLDTLSCSPLCAAPALATGVSPDGLVATGSGTHKTLFGDAHVDALRWPGGGTNESILATAPGGGTSGTGGHTQAGQANDANQTGTILVGESESGGDVRAVVWTSSGSSAALLAQPGGGALPNSTALAISADGSTIVGATNTSTTMTTSLEAAMWSGPGWGTLTLLGDLGASSPRSRAYDVTSDGGIVVGTARNAAGKDRAFLWDAVHGMQDLAQVLLEDYGIDVGAWQLREARGVSDPNGAGEFVVVGAGTNPAGQDEAFVAFLSPVACNDGVDNDGDLLVDWPDDPECNRKSDRSEIADCADGLDNDGDAQIDSGADAGCNDAADPSEEFDCEDGLDNDGDGLFDHPADPGCRRPTHPIEDPACDDGLDNDLSGEIDFPADPGCLAPDDLSETPDCSDGLDDDFDGQIDYPADPDCTGPNDPAEDPQCDDRVDNDFDHATDYPAAYPACTSSADPVEAPQCSDGVDVDGDGQADFPADPECLSASFASESPVYLAIGDLLVLDRHSRSLFRLDEATGAQTRISLAAELTDPQGLALRPDGQLLVADPAGLFEVIPVTGAQRRFSDPVSAEESLQVVVDGAGDALVLGMDQLLSVPWNAGVVQTPSVLVTFPVDAILTYLRGDALVRESGGGLLVSAFGFGGEGVFRITDASQVPPLYQQISPLFATDRFTDLALEADGTIVGAGQRITAGEVGVFRVVPSGGSMGTTTALNIDPAWVSPVAVAVAPDGDVFVADEGTCAGGVCTGATVVRVDPVSGARTDVWSGGDITGPMDLLVVTALPECQDGGDDDGDGLVDFPADAGCRSPWDPSEEPDCQDGLDNDGDGLVDHPADPGCWQPTSLIEAPECSDGIDNDFDGKTDWPADPNCGSAAGATEKKKKGCGLSGAEALPFALLLARRRRRR